MVYRRPLSLLAAFLLAGCSSLDSMMPDVALSDIGIGQPSSQAAKTTGLVVSDEPMAAEVGTSILAQGGNATDAVTAMFFALSVTYPVAAGLGGGGICLVRNAQGRIAEYDFLPRAAGSGGAYAVPGAVAGFYDMQKAYGTLPWQRDVAPAEAYAGTGFPISHVLAQRLGVTQNIIASDSALANEFIADGSLKPEGSVVANPALAGTLAQVRLLGAEGFYTGAVAGSIVNASAGGGRPINSAELAAYRATPAQAFLLRRGEISAALPGASTGAGAFIAGLMGNVGVGGNAQNNVVAALRRTLDGFKVQSVPPDLGATGFAALDANGQAASCAVTLNGPFGSGHSAAEAGLVLAASPSSPGGISGAFLTPMIAMDNGGQVTMAGAGSGGPNGSAAIAYALVRRAAGGGVTRPSDLRSTGLTPFVTANVIGCQNGLCVALPDPGGSGLGAAVDQPIASN